MSVVQKILNIGSQILDRLEKTTGWKDSDLELQYRITHEEFTHIAQFLRTAAESSSTVSYTDYCSQSTTRSPSSLLEDGQNFLEPPEPTHDDPLDLSLSSSQFTSTNPASTAGSPSSPLTTSVIESRGQVDHHCPTMSNSSIQDDTFVCPICGEWLSSEASHNCHRNVHTQIPFQAAAATGEDQLTFGRESSKIYQNSSSTQSQSSTVSMVHSSSVGQPGQNLMASSSQQQQNVCQSSSPWKQGSSFPGRSLTSWTGKTMPSSSSPEMSKSQVVHFTSTCSVPQVPCNNDYTVDNLNWAEYYYHYHKHFLQNVAILRSHQLHRLCVNVNVDRAWGQAKHPDCHKIFPDKVTALIHTRVCHWRRSKGAIWNLRNN